MATITTVQQLQKHRLRSDYEAAYIALSFYAEVRLLRADLLSDKRRCAEIAYRADPTRLDIYRLAPAEVAQLFTELGFIGNPYVLCGSMTSILRSG
jgi:hypothetical protein